jgi:hypothetical protein
MTARYRVLPALRRPHPASANRSTSRRPSSATGGDGPDEHVLDEEAGDVAERARKEEDVGALESPVDGIVPLLEEMGVVAFPGRFGMP